MVVDTSAIIAVVQDEPERLAVLACLTDASTLLISAVNWMECRMVLLGRMQASGLDKAQNLLREAEVKIVPVSSGMGDAAFAAFRNFGKGRHPAGLNFGDCFAYALAKQTGLPLLYKGNDFARTDILSAIES